MWVMGFWTFLLGTPNYRHFKPSGNPLTRIAQVFVAAFRKWEVEAPKKNGAMLYEVEGNVSSIAGSRNILHSDQIRFLDKAATLSGEDYCMLENMKKPWKLCTVTQVEEVKCILKMLPIWLCTQMASLFVEQGTVMNTKIASFHVPPASMSVFDIISVLSFIGVYHRFLIPLLSKFSKNPKGLSELQRMDVGLIVGMVAMVVAGIVELERLKQVSVGKELSSLCILWQIPQYLLIGASEVFMYVGQLEFFNGQAPDGV